ncbi:MAG TPA: hypothetical protein VK731_00950, partial [Candidatus Cybelea sp.]|nr:hypothetical protein [Candidatus Cybelea sp.]
PPWRRCPFKIGARYRVRRDFKALRESFKADEVLTYHSDAWSRYDGITGYFFEQTSTTGMKVWDIDDGEDLEIWRELFEALTDAAKPPAKDI